MPLVSVVTPCFNQASYLVQTIESVLAQDYAPVEHVVVDGGSTDGTVELLRAYERRCPGRIRWISEPDDGQSDALNKGFALASGAIIGWQNSDDFYYPQTFLEPIRYLIEHPDVAVVYGETAIVDEAGDLISVPPTAPFEYARLLHGNYLANQSTFIRREALIEVGGVATDLHYAMDYDLWLRLGLSRRFALVPGVRGAFRAQPEAKTQRNWGGVILEMITAVERIAQRTDLPTDIAAHARAALVQHMLSAFLAGLAEGEVAQAQALLARIRALDPDLAGWQWASERMLSALDGTDWALGHIDSQRRASLPERVLTILGEAGVTEGPPVRQTRALAHLYAALIQCGPNARRQVALGALHAAAIDRWWLRYRGPYVHISRCLLGDAPTDGLRRAVRALRGRGSGRTAAPQEPARSQERAEP